MTILIAPNEDGLGTASWAVRLTRALVRCGHEVRLVTVTGKTAAFLRLSLGDSPARVTVLTGVEDWIAVAKSRGRVLVEATARRVDGYGRYRESYLASLEASGVLQGAGHVIELGVPPLAGGLAGRVPVTTVFDHAWSLSLRRMTGDRPALDRMAEDERRTGGVFLLPAPVTPDEFFDYWRTAGHEPIALSGMLGGGGARPRQDARRVLGIGARTDCVFLSGAGTAVWDGVLRHLVDSLLAREAAYHAVIFSPTECARLKLRLRWQQSAGGWEVETTRIGRVTFIGQVRGETHQAVMAAADLVVSRAGGGTVNDAIAHRIPMLLVEEPGYWQVETIRRSCVALGLAKAVSLERFRSQPREAMEAAGQLRRLPGERRRMHQWDRLGEEAFAETFTLRWG